MIDIIPGTGTEFGSTFIQRAARGCLKELVLGELHQIKAGPAAELGSVFHFLASQYENPATEEILQITDENSILKGETVFKGYSSKYPAGFWGKTLGTELFVKRTKEENDPLVLLSGLECLTGRIDLLLEVQDSDVAKYKVMFDIDIIPGVYIFDWKVTGYSDKFKMEGYLDSVQALQYAYLWSQMTGNPLPVGNIICEIYHRKPAGSEIPAFVKATPYVNTFDWNNRSKERLEGFIRTAGENIKKVRELREKNLEILGNPALCHDRHFTCDMLRQGLCPGY